MLERWVWLGVGVCFGMPLGWLFGPPPSWATALIVLIGCMLLASRMNALRED